MLKLGKLYKIVEHPGYVPLASLKRVGINVGDLILVVSVNSAPPNTNHIEYNLLLPGGTSAVLTFSDDSMIDHVFEEQPAD